MPPEVDVPLADAEEVALEGQAPPPADRDASAAIVEKKPSKKQSVAETHPDSFDWGPFRFTFTGPDKRPPHGQWQAHCPFHRLSDRTGCTRAMMAGPTEQTKQEAKRKLQTWCLLAPHHDRKRHHTSAYLKSSDVLPEGLLDIRLSALKLPTGKAPTDEELDAAEALAAEDKAKPRAKAKAKGKAKAQAKADCKRAASKKSASKKRKADALSDGVPQAAATASSSGTASASGSKTPGASSQSSHGSNSSSSNSKSGSSSSSHTQSSSAASDSD